MQYQLRQTAKAKAQLTALEQSDPVRAKKVKKTLGLIETNIRHHSLQTHKFSDMAGANGEEVFEAYAENRTPAAFRVFFHYGPGQGVITIISISAHP